MLIEILEHVSRSSWYSEPVLQQCMRTISENLFRPLPRNYKYFDYEEEPFEDPASHFSARNEEGMQASVITKVQLCCNIWAHKRLLMASPHLKFEGCRINNRKRG